MRSTCQVAGSNPVGARWALFKDFNQGLVGRKVKFELIVMTIIGAVVRADVFEGERKAGMTSTFSSFSC